MITVWKFALEPLAEDVVLEMPENPKPLHVEMQGDIACLWAQVDSEAPLKKYRFRIVGTGHDVGWEHAIGHVGTFQMDAKLVWHVYGPSFSTHEGAPL